MTRAMPPITMKVRAPMTQAARRSVAAAASVVVAARGVVSVTGNANLRLTRARCPRARRRPMRPRGASLTSAVRGVASRVSGHLAEKSALHSRYRRRHPEALREAQPEPIEQDRLGLVRTDHAAETERARRLSGERQHHVGALDASQFVEDRPWAVAEPGLRLPLLEGPPEQVGQ